jgi:hypothetical protein
MLSGVNADGIKQIVQYRLSPHCTILFVQSVFIKKRHKKTAPMGTVFYN